MFHRTKQNSTFADLKISWEENLSFSQKKKKNDAIVYFF